MYYRDCEDTSWNDREFILDEYKSFSVGDRVQFQFRLYFYDWGW